MIQKGTMLYVAIVGVSFVIMGVLLIPRGCGYRFEFSPDLLTFRTSKFVVRECFCYSQKVSSDSPLLELIKKYRPNDKLVPDRVRWTLVWGEKPNTTGWRGPGGKWHRRGYDSSVIEWSKENPEIADVFWPRVVLLLRAEEYSVVEILLRNLEKTRIDTIDLAIDKLLQDKSLPHPHKAEKGDASI
jgi:hypothetical protein